MNLFDKNILNQKNIFLNNNMVKDYYDDECSLKKRCIERVRHYNNNYKVKIVETYRNFLEINDDCWCGELPKYKDVVIGYINYNNTIIPYTEETTIDTFHHILLNDERFNFVGDDDDLTFQYLFCFLTSVGFLEPRDANGNKLFDVISFFNGFKKQEHIELYVDLTQVIQKRYKWNRKVFDFGIENVKPITTTATRKKLTLKSVAECLAVKRNVNKQISDCKTQ